MKITGRNKEKKQSRDKLFPGRVRLSDLTNARYIGRKPIYDFCVENAKYLTGKCLDFGCGSLQYNCIFTSTESIMGLDVEDAKDFFGVSENVVYYKGDKVPFEDESFDSVYSIECFLCIDDYMLSLSEINRILVKGGYFLVTFPFGLPEMKNALYDYNRFTKQRICDALVENGFEIVRFEGSTASSDTIRRIRINTLRYERKVRTELYKLYTFYANILFCLGGKKRKEIENRFPYGYMVLCQKK